MVRYKTGLGVLAIASVAAMYAGYAGATPDSDMTGDTSLPVGMPGLVFWAIVIGVACLIGKVIFRR